VSHILVFNMNTQILDHWSNSDSDTDLFDHWSTKLILIQISLIRVVGCFRVHAWSGVVVVFCATRVFVFCGCFFTYHIPSWAGCPVQKPLTKLRVVSSLIRVLPGSSKNAKRRS